jgi:VCBS repeat-containing protein
MTTDLQMPAVTPLIRYVGDGSRTDFPYSFPIFASEDMAVFLNGAPQQSGFTVTGAGATAGGIVTFTIAPPSGVVVMLERSLIIERLTDFIEGGDFSAQALNTELDFLCAAVQQVEREQSPMLRYSDNEAPANVDLPPIAIRANMALGFDSAGNPIAVSLAGSMAQPSFTASGTGAVTRNSTDKLSDIISIRDFGAIGDGVTDDTLAIQKALAQHNMVLIPQGTFLITQPITVGQQQSLIGLGQMSVIKCSTNSFDALQLTNKQATVQNLQIQNGLIGLHLFGRDNECTQNNVSDVVILGASTGILLDGYTDPNKPCYWNNFSRVLVDSPLTDGVRLTKSGAGDTPNANRFDKVRVYSHGAATTGNGFYIEYGAFNNAFTDCEANVNGPTAQCCFRVGSNSNKTLLVNLLTESSNGVPNVQLDAGSVETIIANLTSTSDGAAILDNSGGNYDAMNAGYPYKNRLQKTSVTDLTTTLQRFDTLYIDTAGTTVMDMTTSVHIVDATNGAITMQLPNAAAATGIEMTIKKKDFSANIVTVTETTGNGPDGATFQLGGQNDYVTILSNGAEWFITSSNRMAGNTRYADTTGTYQIDMAVDTYLLSSNSGAVTAQLPPANAADAIGRTITIKKTDGSSNAVTVTVQGSTGPDGYAQPLSAQYKAITIVSNGSQWYIVSKF